MSDNTRKSTKSKRSSVKSGDNVIAFPLPEQIKYDVEQLEAFIQTIFRNAKLDEKVLRESSNLVSQSTK
jgi:pseudouridine-5'-phosphate glycosidase